MTEIVEIMARAIAVERLAVWDARHFGETPGGETPEEMRDGFRADAQAALSALREHYAVVPREATEGMLDAATDACHDGACAEWSTKCYANAINLFAAMIAAAEREV